MSQKELAERLGVSEAVVSHDERNEYHAVSVDKAQRVLDALGLTMEVTTAAARPSPRSEISVTSPVN
jgi:transcriptional regulator with XRE-family HTH domain